MRWLWRYWPWLPPSRKEVLAIILGVVIVAALLLAVLIKAPPFRWNANTGFGPDWDCEQMPYGGSVCVKKPPPKSAAPAN
jgi:hypothetical protein